jgi:hypothetical protein
MKIFLAGLMMAGMGLGMPGARAQAPGLAPGLAQMTGQQLIEHVVEREAEAAGHRKLYSYLSVERSERTGGHEWKEWVAETAWGKVRYLVAEDGVALSGDRLARERARIEEEAAHPEAFKQAESAKMEDEQHARSMMVLLPKAFLFEQPHVEGAFLRVEYKPNPAYQPSGMEERVLHAMTGWVLVDPQAMRTHTIEGRMPEDVSIGFGFLATIKAGSSFSTTRDHIEGYDWKTVMIHTDINGKALFLKTVARKQDGRHTEFKQLPEGMTVAEAVKMVEAKS